MKQYISKSALVSEIERRILEDYNTGDEEKDAVAQGAIASLKYYIEDTLEVKEVNLDESARYYLLHEHISPLNEVLHQADLKVEMQYHKDIEDAYKAGFELGLKAQKGE